MAAGVTNTSISDSGNLLFETCINNQDVFEKNFYIPSSPNDTVECGHCINCEAVLEVDTGVFGSETGWELRLDGALIDSRGPYTYTSSNSYVENLAIPDNCFDDCYEITITDSFGDVSSFSLLTCLYSVFLCLLLVGCRCIIFPSFPSYLSPYFFVLVHFRVLSFVPSNRGQRGYVKILLFFTLLLGEKIFLDHMYNLVYLSHPFWFDILLLISVAGYFRCYF